MIPQKLNKWRMRCAFLLCGLLGGMINAPAQSSPAWTLVWSDEFSQPDGSSPNPTNWSYDIGAGGWGNNELEYYTSRTNNARIENGQLVIEARQESYHGSAYTSARLLTRDKWSRAYGRVEARIKTPEGQGIWPAFWMLGTNISTAGWPDCGEIDIMENVGAEPATVHGTVHGPGYSGAGGIGGPFSLSSGAFANDFHVFAVEWTTNQIKWFVDGLQYFRVTPASLPEGTTWVFNAPQFVLLNVAVGGNWPGNPDGSTIFPQRMIVDYVRVYAPASLSACATNYLSDPGFEKGGLANWTTYGAGFNTLLETSADVPVHDGSNVFKVFGQFDGATNYSGVFQDIGATAGQEFKAAGWALTPNGDEIAGANTAWLEVSFRDASTNILSIYRSALIDSNSTAGVWLRLAVMNQLDPITFLSIGLATNLVAPVNTSFVRCQAVFRQPGAAAGAVLFDDMRLASAEVDEIPVPAAAVRAGNDVDLKFDTYLHLPYEIRWKPILTDPVWLLLTNIPGDGGARAVTVDLQSVSRFYRVTRLCN